MTFRTISGCFWDTFFHSELLKYVDLLTDYQGILQYNGSYVEGCHRKSQQLGSEYFGLKEGGNCWTSEMYSIYPSYFEQSKHPSYFEPMAQSGTNCEFGIGGRDHIFIYHNRKLKNIYF